jgi:hypothetical protein
MDSVWFKDHKLQSHSEDMEITYKKHSAYTPMIDRSPIYYAQQFLFRVRLIRFPAAADLHVRITRQPQPCHFAEYISLTLFCLGMAHGYFPASNMLGGRSIP